MKPKLLSIACLLIIAGFLKASAQSEAKGKLEFKLSFPASVSDGPLTGRMFLIVSRTDSIELRYQVGRYGTEFFGVDFENLKPTKEVIIDGTVLGYPINNLKEVPRLAADPGLGCSQHLHHAGAPVARRRCGETRSLRSLRRG